MKSSELEYTMFVNITPTLLHATLYTTLNVYDRVLLFYERRYVNLVFSVGVIIDMDLLGKADYVVL